MVNLDYCVESRAGISLVTLVVENPTAVARRVRVANLLDGPVWPPRREGVPEAGWDGGGYEGVVGPGESRPLGYASPTPPAEASENPRTDPSEEPPAEIVWTERAPEIEQAGETEANGRSRATANEETPESVVRSLGDPRPPADAVPTPAGDADRVVRNSLPPWRHRSSVSAAEATHVLRDAENSYARPYDATPGVRSPRRSR